MGRLVSSTRLCFRLVTVHLDLFTTSPVGHHHDLAGHQGHQHSQPRPHDGPTEGIGATPTLVVDPASSNMSFRKLFLSEAPITLITIIRYLFHVHQHMSLKVALGESGVGAMVTLETLFPILTLLMNMEVVTVREGLPTHLTRNLLLNLMKLLHV